MTNIQLLLLATNNIKHSTELSHTQESYVYQYYHANIVNKYTSIKDFLTDFIEQTASALESDSSLSEQRQNIYAVIESYLENAESRFIQRQKLLQKK